jgi:hypothetical protein
MAREERYLAMEPDERNGDSAVLNAIESRSLLLGRL